MMIEDFVLKEIMQLNTEISAISISGRTFPTLRKEQVLMLNCPSEETFEQEFNKPSANTNSTLESSQQKTCGFISVTTGLTNVTLESCDTENNTPKPRRSTRKRFRSTNIKAAAQNHLSKIKRLNNNSNSDVEKYYLNKTVKRLPSTLETIFEEPKNKNNGDQYIGNRKFKRTINFEDGAGSVDKSKRRKRQLNMEKLSITKRFTKRKKISMATFLKHLSNLDSDNDDDEEKG